MSAELKQFLEKELKQHYSEDTNSFPPHLQEEYLTNEGWLDKQYICKSLKLHMSTATFRKVVKSVFDSTQFVLYPTTTDFSREEFEKIYKFAKYQNPRAWIAYIFNTTGKVVKREDLYNWIISI